MRLITICVTLLCVFATGIADSRGVPSWAANSENVASTPNCAASCGGCTSGRCDVFGCKAGLYCCDGNVISPNYGACCSTCNGKPAMPTAAPTATPACEPGHYTPHHWFPWTKPPKPCSGKTIANKGCQWLENKFLSKFDGQDKYICDNELSPCHDIEKTCVEQEIAALEDSLPFDWDPEAWVGLAAAELGIYAKCKFLAWGCGKLCDKAVGFFTGGLADKLTDLSCQGYEDLFHWIFDHDESELFGNASAPQGFPAEFQMSSTISTVYGNVSMQMSTAYSAAQNIFWQKETIGDFSHVVRRTLQQGDANSCVVEWNKTNCRVAFSRDKGMLPGALPQNYLTFLTGGVYNGTVLNADGNITENGVVLSRWASDSKATGSQLLYYEAPTGAGPVRLDEVDVNGTLATTYKFGNAEKINPKDWEPPAFCPTSAGTCLFKCKGMGWGQCANATYGLLSNSTSNKYAACARQFGFTSFCPSSFPYCTPGGCFSAPYVCPANSHRKSFGCKAGYGCCSTTSALCYKGPCTVAHPAADVAPAADDFTDGTKVAPIPPPSSDEFEFGKEGGAPDVVPGIALEFF